eukprot:jgi/Astpho2/2403/e_gw1.00044.162.1_t
MAPTPTQGSGSWTRCMATAGSALPAAPAMRDNGTTASIMAAAHSPGLMAAGIRAHGITIRCMVMGPTEMLRGMSGQANSSMAVGLA